MSFAPDRIPPGRIRLTYDDYVGLPNDGKRYEILDGELFVTPAPRPRHQQVSINLEFILLQHIRGHRLGQILHAPIDLILDPATVAQPDILFIRAGREAIISERGIEGAPTLVVEVLSPSTARLDRDRKMKLYAEHGVPYYWIVDPESRSVEAYTLTGTAYALAGRVTGEPAPLPPFRDLTIDPASIWS